MGKRAGLKYVARQRLDALMAIGEKRSAAKEEARLRGESLFAFTDNKIHSYISRTNYQRVVMRFITWLQKDQDIHRVEEMDAHADTLASRYLESRIAAGYSAWTLQTDRSALRMFFQNRRLAARVELPTRKREEITRSRGPAYRDRNIQEANWQHVIQFCLACGLRRAELRDLKVSDVYPRASDGHLVVQVRRGKGGKWREVPVFPGREEAVLSQVRGKKPDEHVFEKLGALDIHSYRRQFAQDLYVQVSGRPLPPQEGRLHHAELDMEAALYVSRCLGHNRLDIIFRSYIR